VKYRRVYAHENEDGSTTVTSYGPITTGQQFWRSPFADWLRVSSSPFSCSIPGTRLDGQPEFGPFAGAVSALLSSPPPDVDSRS